MGMGFNLGHFNNWNGFCRSIGKTILMEMVCFAGGFRFTSGSIPGQSTMSKIAQKLKNQRNGK